MALKIIIMVIAGIIFLKICYHLFPDKVVLISFVLGVIGGYKLKVLFQVVIILLGILFYFYLILKKRKALGATFSILSIIFLSMFYGNFIYGLYHLSIFTELLNCSPSINCFIR